MMCDRPSKRSRRWSGKRSDANTPAPSGPGLTIRAALRSAARDNFRLETDMPKLIETDRTNARWKVTARQRMSYRTFGWLTTSEAEELCQRLIANGWSVGVVPSEGK